jgi:acyl-CoA synthetase (AMP-forming)/AMP-acid ligase II
VPGLNVSWASELESLLVAAPGVRFAAAGERSGQLVGWIVADSLSTFSMEEVYEHVARLAAPNALPDYLLLVDDIPLLPSGGVDRRGLVWP